MLNYSMLLFFLQIFLRSGVLSHLEEERDARLGDQVIRLQALCRGHLARRNYQKLKVGTLILNIFKSNIFFSFSKLDSTVGLIKRNAFTPFFNHEAISPPWY